MKTNIFNKQKKFEQEVLSGEYAVGDMEYSSYYKDSFKRLKKNKMSMFCLIVIVLLILIAIFAPLIAPAIRTCRITPRFYRRRPNCICLAPTSMDATFYRESFTEQEFP